MMRFTQWAAWLLATAGLLGLAVGCNKSASTTSESTGGPGPMAGGPMGGFGGPGGPGGARVDETEPHLAGKKAFNASCSRCHSVTAGGGPGGGQMTGAGGPPPGGPGPGGGPPGAGPGGAGPGGPPRMGGGGRGPSLNKFGADSTHTVAWLTELVRDPKSKKENARMPAFDQSKISDADLRDLAEFLMTLK